MIHRTKIALRTLLPKNAFARGVSVLVGGTAGAQLISVLAAPLLTRLYSPEDFGLVAVYGSLLALIGVISSLRYELAIPLPEDDVEAANVAALSLLLVALTTLLSGVLVAFLASPIATALGVPVLADYLWLLPVGVLLGGSYTVFNYWAVRTKRFSTIASTRIRQSLATLAIQLAAFKLGGLALLLGQVAGQSVGTSSLARPALAMPAFRQVSWGGVKTAVKRFKQFPMYSVPGGFLNTAGRQLPPVFIAAILGPLEAGLYSLATRIIQIPLQLINQATAQVFVSHAVEAHRQGWLDRIFIDVYLQSLHIFVLPLAFIGLVSPFVFAYIFGEAWSVAGILVAILTPWILMIALVSPLSSVVGFLNRQGTFLIFEIMMVFIRLGGLIYGLIKGSLTLGVALFVCGAVISIFACILWLARISGVSEHRIVNALAKEITFASILVGAGWFLLSHEYYIAASYFLAVLFLLSGLRAFFALSRGVDLG